MANPEKEMAIFFTRGGELGVDTSQMRGDLMVRWLDIAHSRWLEPQKVAQKKKLLLETPLHGRQAVLVQLA